jgi:hypothetical protein
MSRLFAIGALFSACVLTYGCKTSSKPPPPDDPPPVVPSATTPVPQAMPVADFDASLEPLDGKTPLEQARIYESRGQLWLAQMSLEKQALGPSGTKEEAELLAWICHRRDEPECVRKCEAKLGRKLKLDGGAPGLLFDAGREHDEPTSDVARARDHVLKENWQHARLLLEPRVVDGNATKEEIRLLKQVCREQGDRMCVALCDAKLK